MSSTMTKRALGLLFAMLAALMIAPGIAFADDSWESISDDTAVFAVEVDNADGTISTSEFTKGQMTELAKANTKTVYYTFKSGKTGLNTAAVEEYVTIEQLLSSAKVSFEANDTIMCKSSSFTPNSGVEYSVYTQERKYYPGYTLSGFATTANDTVVPGVIALKYGTANTNEENKAAGLLEKDALAASKYQGLRNFWGKTAEEYSKDGNMGGNPYCSGAETLVISKPFNVYERAGKGAKTLKKSYYRYDLEKLATSANEGVGFLFNKKGWQVGVTTSYVPVSTLLADAFGSSFALKQNQSIVATADGFATTLSYDQYMNGKYFYPATTSTDVVADGAEEVGTVLALNWRTTGENLPLATTAGKTKREIAESGDLTTQYRIFTGLTATDDPNTGGNRFATGPAELSVTTIKDINDASIKVTGVKKSYEYTGSAIEPTVTVKDGDEVLSVLNEKKVGDYEIAYSNNVNKGSATITITGKNSYTGEKKITFTIAKKTNTITTSKKAITQSYKANAKGKLAKAKSIKLSSALSPKATYGKVTYTVKKADPKKVLSLKSGKVTVKKGAKVGKYSMTVKLSAPGNDTYQSATKSVKVTVSVTKK